MKIVNINFYNIINIDSNKYQILENKKKELFYCILFLPLTVNVILDPPF